MSTIGKYVWQSFARGALAVSLVFTSAPALPASSDFDGGDLPNGISDILWRNVATGENYIYTMNGLAIKPTEGYIRTVGDLDWQVVGVGDFNGDGKADVLWRNFATGENYIYMMNGLAIVNEGPIRLIADLAWTVAGVADIDGDGKADIVWRNAATGENYLYPMDGLTIKGNEGYFRTVADLNWRMVGFGDFNGDGKADILWRNSSTGENYIYPMNGATILATEGAIRPVLDPNWRVAGVGDFTGDNPHKADILWRNIATGENYIYPMNGTTILATEGYIRTVALPWQVVQVGDFNGDGKADILWRNSSTGENYIYPMNGTIILASEGYTRQVADLNWLVQPGSGCPRATSAAITILPSAPPGPGFASRVTGVAPLAVFFDAAGTTATSTTRPFHDLQFAWNFGDAGSGNWGPTGLSRNTATGGVSAHVYEKPGTYEACVTAFDGTNVSSKSVTITVTDPEAVFSGNNTICVRQSATGTFAGCPVAPNATTNQTVSTFAGVLALATPGKRVLMRRGDVWTPSSSGFLVPDGGPGILGAFGTGAKPRIASTAGGNQILLVGQPSSPNFSDWRLMDFEIDGTNSGNTLGIEAIGKATKLLFLRLNIHDTGAGGLYMSEFVASGQNAHFSQIGVVDTTITNASYGSYFAANASAFLGCSITNTPGNQGVGVWRTQYFTRSTLGHNLFGGSPVGFHVVKFGAGKSGNGTDGNPPPPLYVNVASELSVVSDNVVDDRQGGGGWVFPVGPENNVQDEEVRDVVFERNWFRAGPNTEAALMLFASKITARNNIFDMTGSTAGTNGNVVGIQVDRRGIEPVPFLNHAYNNTAYRADAWAAAFNQFNTVRFTLGTQMMAKNNLAVAPLIVGAGNKAVIADGAVATVLSNNLLVPVALLPTTIFAGPFPANSVSAFKLKPTAGITIIDAGTTVPTYLDFFRKRRPAGAARDIGASELPQ